MTQAAFPPVVTDHDLKRMRAEGRCIRAMSREAIVIRADLHPAEPRLWRSELLYADWPKGPRAAKVVGRNWDNSVFYVEIGTTAVVKGRAIVDRIPDVELPRATLRPLRVKRTGRRLSWWAARVVWRNVEPIGLAKETG